MTITKNIGYAYPTSPLAKELGYGPVGCWYIALYDDDNPIKNNNVCAAAEKREGLISLVPAFAGSHVAWGKYSMHKE